MILREAQILVVPQVVRQLLGMRKFSILSPILPAYKLAGKIGVDHWIKSVLLPKKYQQEIAAMNTKQ